MIYGISFYDHLRTTTSAVMRALPQSLRTLSLEWLFAEQYWFVAKKLSEEMNFFEDFLYDIVIFLWRLLRWTMREVKIVVRSPSWSSWQCPASVTCLLDAISKLLTQDSGQAWRRAGNVEMMTNKYHRKSFIRFFIQNQAENEDYLLD